MGYQTKNTATYSYKDETRLEGLITATAGLAMGCLGLTYTGGDILVAGTDNTYGYQTRNISTFTYQTKN